RPFGDALYASDIFPWSYVLTGEEGNDPGYDPLAIMVQKAQEHGLRIEAWINPYRVRAKGSPKAICAENPVNAYLKSGSNAVIRYDGGTYYNPASQAARDLITEGVIEIIKNYAVDGIHFDDYFYPTTDAAFDASDYRAYRSSGGSMALADWRRENVNKLVRQVYAAVKQEKSSVLFGISPQARIDTNYNVQYADVGKWLSGSGYVDYICPQIYFGFEHDTAPYSTLLDSWNQMAKGSGVDLYVGLAVYKCGVADGGAGSAKNEWINTDAMLEHQVEEARGKSAYAGFVLYRYDSIFRPASAVQSCIARERANLESIL
ncbi:MAG: family 10 glycosylhydrolase, partial [Oscillospiraceae bacterium]